MTQMKEKFPNQLFYLVLITLEEVMGKQGLNAILNYCGLTKFRDNFPPNNMEEDHSSEDFTTLMSGCIDVMGEQGIRPILFRGGIRAFEIMNEQFPTLFNINGITPEELDAARAFEEFLKHHQLSNKDVAQIEKGKEDLAIVTGPHLGEFGREISIPELTEFLEVASATCVVGKYVNDN